MRPMIDELALKAMTRKDAINELMAWQRYQLQELHKRLGLKTCRCKQSADLVIQIAGHLHPQQADNYAPVVVTQERLM